MKAILLLVVVFGIACSKIEKRESTKNDSNIETVKYITKATLSRIGCDDLSEKIIDCTLMLNNNIVYHINDIRTLNLNRCKLQFDMDLNIDKRKGLDEVYCYISIKF